MEREWNRFVHKLQAELNNKKIKSPSSSNHTPAEAGIMSFLYFHDVNKSVVFAS